MVITEWLLSKVRSFIINHICMNRSDISRVIMGSFSAEVFLILDKDSQNIHQLLEYVPPLSFSPLAVTSAENLRFPEDLVKTSGFTLWNFILENYFCVYRSRVVAAEGSSWNSSPVLNFLGMLTGHSVFDLLLSLSLGSAFHEDIVRDKLFECIEC